ncbi:hypothetical protein KYJ98_02290 [Mammaliicoccus lentus]|uniref:hypothetical protein n=1 Tax=Mammaliicoccus TaxID=2803850 RepID=UPI001C4DE2E8|nr:MULTISPECIES: hypothetical protein [Mammaliicoccus]MBW0769169.1 hypothetical protein [Mammaliicoccus lentus]
MIESIFSILASILTIFSLMYAFIFNSNSKLTKQDTIQQNVGVNNTNIKNEQKIDIKHNTQNYVKNTYEKLNTNQDDNMMMVMLGIGLLLAISIYIMFSTVIITISCILILVISWITIYRLKKFELPIIRSYFYFCIKYIVLSLLLVSTIYFKPTTISTLEMRLDTLHIGGLNLFLKSFSSLLVTTFGYFKELNFPSIPSFIIISRFVGIIAIFTNIFSDFRKSKILKIVNSLYTSTLRHICNYIWLLLGFVFAFTFLHLYIFEENIEQIVNFLINWINK